MLQILKSYTEKYISNSSSKLFLPGSPRVQLPYILMTYTKFLSPHSISASFKFSTLIKH